MRYHWRLRLLGTRSVPTLTLVALVALVVSACAGAGAGNEGDAAPGADAGAPDAAPIDALPPPDAAPDAYVPICGDGLVEGAELCDDGNSIETDGCPGTCAWASCGDGFVRTGVEQCDDSNTASGDACSALCLTCAGGNGRFTWDGNHHCYTRFDAAATFVAARDACAAARGHLVTIAMEAENLAVTTALLGLNVSHWLGFTDLQDEGLFRWVTGEPAPFTRFRAGEPNDASGNEDCGEIVTDGFWNDIPCGSTRAAICEDDGWVLRAEDNHAYRAVYRELSWNDALADCAALGGHLATISSAAEDAFVNARVFGQLWIGASDSAVEGTFTWATGEAFSYTGGFGPGEPNNAVEGEDCLELRPGTGWNDQSCSNLRSYVCEVD